MGIILSRQWGSMGYECKCEVWWIKRSYAYVVWYIICCLASLFVSSKCGKPGWACIAKMWWTANVKCDLGWGKIHVDCKYVICFCLKEEACWVCLHIWEDLRKYLNEGFVLADLKFGITGCMDNVWIKIQNSCWGMNMCMLFGIYWQRKFWKSGAYFVTTY